MILWKSSLDQFITVHPVPTTSFLPIIFNHPGSPISVHIALYLPTSGQESEFVEQITLLSMTIDDLKEKYSDPLIYIRGDSNVNDNNKERAKIFDNFCNTLHMTNIPTNHKAYHHFLGDGLFDSCIDVILESSSDEPKRKSSVSLTFQRLTLIMMPFSPWSLFLYT